MSKSKDEKVELSPEEELKKEEEKVNAEAKAEAEAEAKAAESKGETPGEETPEEETPGSESTPGETENPSEEENPESETLEDDQDELTDADQAKLKAKTQRRIRELTKKAKRADELEKENSFLKSQKGIGNDPIPQAPTKPTPESAKPVSTGKLPWGDPKPQAPLEVSQDEYDQDIETKAQGMVKNALAGQERIKILESDVRHAEQEFTELNAGKQDPVTQEILEKNPDFDLELTQSIINWYKKQSAADPNLRFLVFARQVMSLRAKGAEKAKSEVSKKVATQAAKQAIPPTGAPAKGKGDSAITEMLKSATTEEELAEAEKLLPHADN